MQGPVGQTGLLFVEAPLEGAPGVVELADDSDQTPVAAEPHHIGGQDQEGLAHAQAATLLVQHRGGDVPPGEVGLGHAGQYGILQDGLLPLLGQDGLVLVGGRHVGDQPSADELGAQSGRDVGVAPQVHGELFVDHPPDFVGPGQQGPSQGLPLCAHRGIHRSAFRPAAFRPAVGVRRWRRGPVGTALDPSTGGVPWPRRPAGCPGSLTAIAISAAPWSAHPTSSRRGGRGPEGGPQRPHRALVPTPRSPPVPWVWPGSSPGRCHNPTG